jgi:hypothetical protein
LKDADFERLIIDRVQQFLIEKVFYFDKNRNIEILDFFSHRRLQASHFIHVIQAFFVDELSRSFHFLDIFYDRDLELL